MCAKLHDENEPVKIIEDLYHWWHFTENGDPACKWIDDPLKFYSSNSTFYF